MQPRVSWLLMFLGFTTFGILNFQYRYLDNLARGLHHTFAIRLFEEMTGAYVGLLLFPFVIWAIRRARIRRDNWRVTVPFNLLVYVCLFRGRHNRHERCAKIAGSAVRSGAIRLRNYAVSLPDGVGTTRSPVLVRGGSDYTFDSYREARDHPERVGNLICCQIAIALKTPGKGEDKAHARDIACWQQLSR